MKKTASLFSVPYLLWLLLFVVAPVLMLLYQSFFDISGNFTLDNYGTFFSSWTYLRTVSYTHLTLPTTSRV